MKFGLGASLPVTLPCITILKSRYCFLRPQLLRIFLQVAWGKITMVDAERRLLANALKDPDNLHFVLLSER